MRTLLRLLVQFVVSVVRSRPSAEFVVVTLLILLVCSLAGPSLLRQREQARQLQLKSRFKEIGMHLNTYHETYSSYPSNASTRQQPSIRSQQPEPPPDLISPL